MFALGILPRSSKYVREQKKMSKIQNAYRTKIKIVQKIFLEFYVIIIIVYDSQPTYNYFNVNIFFLDISLLYLYSFYNLFAC